MAIRTVDYLSGIFSEFLLKLVIAIIIILIGFIIGRIAGRLVKKVLYEIELNRIMKKTVNVRISIDEAIGSIVSYIIYFITVVVALKEIGVATFVLNLVFAGVIVVVILAVFLSIKDFVPNMMAGIAISHKKYMKKGDFIKVKDSEGTIIHMALIETIIKTRSGDILHIPNSIVLKEKVLVKKK